MKRQRIGSETCPKCEQGIKYNCSNQTVQQRLNYKRGNYKRINENLSNTDWNEVINRSSTNEAWESFADIINRTIKENIPECKVFEKKYDTPWMTKGGKRGQKTKTKDIIGNLENDNGEIETDSKERAEILNNFFTSVFTNEDTANIPDFDERNYETPLTNIQINEEDVKTQI